LPYPLVLPHPQHREQKCQKTHNAYLNALTWISNNLCYSLDNLWNSEDYSLLGHTTMQSRWSGLKFQTCVLPPPLGRWIMTYPIVSFWCNKDITQLSHREMKHLSAPHSNSSYEVLVLTSFLMALYPVNKHVSYEYNKTLTLWRHFNI
jgi:hypothetical protein